METPYKISFENLLIKLEDREELRHQLMSENPFTLSHKDLV